MLDPERRQPFRVLRMHGATKGVGDYGIGEYAVVPRVRQSQHRVGTADRFEERHRWHEPQLTAVSPSHTAPHESHRG